MCYAYNFHKLRRDQWLRSTLQGELKRGINRFGTFILTLSQFPRYICLVRQRQLWSGSLTFFNLPVLNPVSPSLQLSLSTVSTGLHSEAHGVLISLRTQASLVPTSSRPLRHHPSHIPGFLCPLECSLHPSLFGVSFQCILIMSMTNYYRRIIAQRIRAGTVGVFGEQPSVPRPDPSWLVSTVYPRLFLLISSCNKIQTPGDVCRGK